MIKVRNRLLWVLVLAFAAPLQNQGSNTEPKRTTRAELECLTRNIYHEARGEPLQGQLAVAQVTLNRSKLTNKSVCSTVYARRQFSWTIKLSKAKVRDYKAWQQAEAVAKAILTETVSVAKLLTATHYHLVSINPRWNRQMRVLAVIGNHVFYESSYT